MKRIFFVFFFATVFWSATEQTENDEIETLRTKLNRAIDDGDVNEVQSLLDRGAPLTSTISRLDGKPIGSPLHNAITNKRMAEIYQKNIDTQNEILKLLVNKAKDLEVVDMFGQTPLYKAVDHENPQAVKILLEHGANPNAYTENKLFSYKKSALHTAISKSEDIDEEIILLLIEHGADINLPNEEGQTPLHRAIFKGFKKSIEKLIEKGANVNAVDDSFNMTPLHFIAVVDSSRSKYPNWTDEDGLKFAEQLINHGANVHAMGMYKTPIDLATSPKLKEYLRSKM